MPKKYPNEIRRKSIELLLAGGSLSTVSEATGMSIATLSRWRRQAFVDAGVLPGTKSTEADPLALALKTIEALEHELAITRAATALFNGEEVVDPKGAARLPRA